MNNLDQLFQTIKQRDPNQPEFHQAVEEVFGSLQPFWRRIRNTCSKACWNAL